jgi:hypothetical protein
MWRAVLARARWALVTATALTLLPERIAHGAHLAELRGLRVKIARIVEVFA